MTPAYTVVDVPQRSPEWFEARLGRLTGSVAADMLATIKSGEAAARRNPRVSLVLERLTGRAQDDGYVSAAMQQGIDREAEARSRYEALTGSLAQETGFVQCAEIMAGVSLDGCVMRDGRIVTVLELKCPTPAIHLDYLKTGRIPDRYFAQMLHALWVTGAESAEWMSYNPDFPEGLQEKLIRVARDEQAIVEYAARAMAFLEEVDRECALVRGMVA